MRIGHAGGGQGGGGNGGDFIAHAIGGVAQFQRDGGAGARQLDVTIFYRNAQVQTRVGVARGAQGGADIFYRYTHVTMVP
ncbi:hypothetical protein D3C72_1081010 [compost metagenome]